jgi:AAA family ATP:ADP antiporter
MFRLDTIKNYVLKIFDLQEDELKKTLLLQLNIFLLISTLLIVKPVINSLFLSELTADALPIGYLLTAFMAVAGSWFYTKALERFALNHIIERTLWVSVVSLVLFGILFRLDIAHGLFLYIPYIWIAIFGLLTASQFWILANLVYNVRSAKRVFGFIGGGAIAGGIFGGYLTSLLTNIIEAEMLLFVAAFLLLGCLPITRYIWKTEVLDLNSFQVSIRSDPKAESPFRLIRQSKLLYLIALVIGISVLVAKLVDYQYSDYASRLIEDPEQLAAFFGFWFSTLSVISLIVQLFLTKRIVGTFGVGKSLLWLPTGILIGSFTLLFLPQLWVVVFIKVVDGSLKQSVNKAATELLSIPIPIEIKKKTKTFTDVVIDSLATGIAGIILIFLINALDIPSTYISIIIISLILLWLFFIYRLRKEYISAFKALLETTPETKEKIEKPDIPVTTIVETVKRVLRSGSESQILYMLQKTLEAKDERFFKVILELISHPSAAVRALAIENLYFLKTQNLVDRMEKLIFDPDQEVTTKAFRYLIKNNRKDIVELFATYLGNSDNTIANAALLGLSLELRNNKKLQHRFNFEGIIQRSIKNISQFDDQEIRENKISTIVESIGNARLSSMYDSIDQRLANDQISIEHLNRALSAAATTLDERFIGTLVSHLPSKETREAAVNGLLGYGTPIIQILTDKVMNEEYEIELAVQVIPVIEKFASQRAISALIELTENTEHAVKIEAIEAIQRLKWQHKHLTVNDSFVVAKVLDECGLYQNTLSVIHSQIIIQYKHSKPEMEYSEEREARNQLLRMLEARLDRQLQRIFRLLGIKYPPNDVEPILNTILKGKEEQRIHAIEFLDNILNSQLKKELIPVAESVLIDTISEEKIKKLNLKVLSEEECYRALLDRKDLKLKLAVINLIQKSNNKRFLPLITSLLNETNEKLRSKVTETINTLSD